MLAQSWLRLRRDPGAALSAGALFLFGFTIPIDPGLVAVATIVVVALWLALGRFRLLPALWRTSAVMRAALILFALLAIGLLYSPVDLSEGLTTLKKYRELLLVPILMALASTEKERQSATWGFIAAMLLTLAISFGEELGFYNVGRESEPTAFHHRIIYGIFVVYTLFWTAHRIADGTGTARWLWLAVILVGSYMLLYATGSRTGYVLYFVMAMLFAWQRFAWRGTVVAALALGVLLVFVMNTSPRFSYRVDRAVTATVHHQWDRATTPTGKRIDQWRRTVFAIGDAPAIGHGTGAYGVAVAPYLDGRQIRGQPHNEYLLITVQLGAVGLAAFLALLFVQWRAARVRPPPDRFLGEGLIVAFAVACLFNSSLLNSPEGHFWALFSAVLLAPRGPEGAPDGQP